MNSFYLSRNSEGAMPGHQFIAVFRITQMNYKTFL